MIDTQIKAKMEVKTLLSMIGKYKKEQIECTKHTFFRLSEAQRKIYTANELTRILLKEIPFLTGVQFNDNYALFYRYDNKVLKVIISLNIKRIDIITFYFIEEWQVPKI